MATLRIAGGTLLPMTEGTPTFAADLWIRDGAIASIGPLASGEAADETIDAAGCLVLPGFVQAHLHLVQTLHRGEAEDLPLLDWLAKVVWPLEAAHDEATLRAAARCGLAECVEAGATTLLDMGTTHGHEAILEEIVKSGIRALSGKAMMDLDPQGRAPRRLRESTARSLEESEELARAFDGAGGGRVRYAYAPRFALSASRDLHLEVARRAAATGRRVHTHASETASEVAAVRAEHGASPIAFLAGVGLDTGRFTLAHAVHLEPGDARRLAASGTGVAHCPASNLKLGSGIADVPALRAAGVAVGLGSDGAPCNNRLDPFREMWLAALLPRRGGSPGSFGARDALALATREGARAVGLGDAIGTLEPGKRADVLVFDPNLPGCAPARDPFAAIVFGGSPAHVRDVVCDGAILKRDFSPLRFEPREVAADARSAQARLVARARRDGAALP